MILPISDIGDVVWRCPGVELLRDRCNRAGHNPEHPMITFRDGLTGRRAVFICGPDIWEVASWVAESTDEDSLVELVDDRVIFLERQKPVEVSS